MASAINLSRREAVALQSIQDALGDGFTMPPQKRQRDNRVNRVLLLEAIAAYLPQVVDVDIEPEVTTFVINGFEGEEPTKELTCNFGDGEQPNRVVMHIDGEAFTLTEAPFVFQVNLDDFEAGTHEIDFVATWYKEDEIVQSVEFEVEEDTGDVSETTEAESDDAETEASDDEPEATEDDVEQVEVTDNEDAPPDDTDSVLSNMNKADLLALAEAQGAGVSARMTKAQLIEAIEG